MSVRPRRAAAVKAKIPVDDDYEEEFDDVHDDPDVDMDEDAPKAPAPGEKRERRKIKIKYIEDRGKRLITFCKRKAGIMKKAYELSHLTGTQVLLLIASETGHVYSFATTKFQPIVQQAEGKRLIQMCLLSDEGDGTNTGSDPSGSEQQQASPQEAFSRKKRTSTGGDGRDSKKKKFEGMGKVAPLPSHMLQQGHQGSDPQQQMPYQQQQQQQQVQQQEQDHQQQQQQLQQQYSQQMAAAAANQQGLANIQNAAELLAGRGNMGGLSLAPLLGAATAQLSGLQAMPSLLSGAPLQGAVLDQHLRALLQNHTGASAATPGAAPGQFPGSLLQPGMAGLQRISSLAPNLHGTSANDTSLNTSSNNNSAEVKRE